MTEEKAKGPAPKKSARALQIRQKAKVTAAAKGKDWSAMSKEERQASKKVAREALKAEGMLLRREPKDSSAD